MGFSKFDKSLFDFLSELESNNNRTWFQANKSRFEECVQGPSLEFIEAFAPRLRKISPCFMAIAQKSGGSLMRIYRDTRFARDKTPYKSNVGIQFRHDLGKGVHCPGFYVHLETSGSFLGIGIWHPDSPTLTRIRSRIDENPAAWKRARDNPKFRARLELSGESLKSPPRGIDKEHPLIEDLKRKDHVAVESLSRKQVLSKDLIDHVAESFAAARPYMRFLCHALDMPF